MKLTAQSGSSILNNTLHKLVLLIIGLAITSGCSSDDNDGPNTSINAKTQTFMVNGLNNCNTSIGTGSTLLFTISYTTSPGLTIDKLRIKSTVTNGESSEDINTQFTDNGSTITWAICFRYGPQDWVDYEVEMEATNGTISNPITTRVNKPSGAN